MNTRLRILCEQEYIGRRYDSSYRLQAKFATVLLTAKGIEVLKAYPEHFNKQVLRNIKKDVDASDRFVRHCINIFAVFAKLKELYGRLRVIAFTSILRVTWLVEKAEGFPKPLPDAFASFSKHQITAQTLSHRML